MTPLLVSILIPYKYDDDHVPFREGLFCLFCLHELVGHRFEEECLIGGVARLTDV